MRDVSQKSALGSDQRFDAAGHHIEITAQLPDLIAPREQFLIDPRRKITCRQLMCGAAQLDDWSREVSGEPEAEQPADQEHRQETSRYYPQTKGERTGFSQTRRRPREIR